MAQATTLVSIRDWVYAVREGLNQTGPDSLLSNRLIYTNLLKTLYLLIRRDSDTRKIWGQTPLFTSTVIELTTQANDTARSIKPLPELFTGATGPFLRIDQPGWAWGNPLLARTGGNYLWLDTGFLVISKPLVHRLPVTYWAKPQPVLTQSWLDALFTVPDHLAEDLLKVTVTTLAQLPGQLPTDTYPNNNPLDVKNPVSKG